MTTQPRITTTATMNITGGLTAEAMISFAQSIPPEARVTVQSQQDRNELLTTLTATWNSVR